MQTATNGYSVGKGSAGLWEVRDDIGNVLSEHASNAQAWRQADRLNNEAVNKSQDTSDWIARKTLRGE